MSGLLKRPLQTFRQDRLTLFDPAAPPVELAGHPQAARLLALWQSWRGDRPAPERADLDPLALRELLTDVFLLDVLDDDFAFRLVGEAVNARFDHRLKGRRLRELLAGVTLDETLYEHRRCAEDLQAVLVRNTPDMVLLTDRNVYVRLLLPVGVRDGRARHIIGVMTFPGRR